MKSNAKSIYVNCIINHYNPWKLPKRKEGHMQLNILKFGKLTLLFAYIECIQLTMTTLIEIVVYFHWHCYLVKLKLRIGRGKIINKIDNVVYQWWANYIDYRKHLWETFASLLNDKSNTDICLSKHAGWRLLLKKQHLWDDNCSACETKYLWIGF